MNPEIITAFTAGVATTALTGGLVAALTCERLRRRHLRRKAASTESGPGARLAITSMKEFVAAVEDLAVTAAATNGPNRLLYVKSNGFEDVEDTYGPYAASLAQSAFATGLASLAGPRGITGHFAQKCFGLLADEDAVAFVSEHGLAVEILLVAEPDHLEDLDPALYRSGDDYYWITGPDDDTPCDLEVYDRIRCEANIAWTWYEPGDNVKELVRGLERHAWLAYRDHDFTPVLVVPDTAAGVSA